MKILFIDDKSEVIYDWVKELTKIVNLSDKKVESYLLSDRLKSEKSNYFNVVNIETDIQQKKSIEELQSLYDFSIYESLVTDRNITNYTSFNNIYKYNNNNYSESLTSYINAFDYLFREEIDIVFTGLADNFKFNLAWRIAEFYNKKFYIFYALYWFNDGLMLSDRYDQTSSVINCLYNQYYTEEILDSEKNQLKNIFENKKVSFDFSDNKVYPLLKRLKFIKNKQGTYESLSIKNFILRKINFYFSNIVKKVYIDRKYKNIIGLEEEYLLFPLHVAPEATLLGANPELADQFSLIKNISIHLPYGVKLYVKEHPAQIFGYDLNYEFYFKLFSLNNVEIIKAKENAYELLSHKKCLGMIVINGTLGLESALKYRKPIFVLGNIYYKIADCFIKLDNYKDIFSWIQKIQKKEWKFDEHALWAILKAINSSVIRSKEVDYNRCKSWKEYNNMRRHIYKEIILKDKNIKKQS